MTSSAEFKLLPPNKETIEFHHICLNTLPEHLARYKLKLTDSDAAKISFVDIKQLTKNFEVLHQGIAWNGHEEHGAIIYVGYNTVIVIDRSTRKLAYLEIQSTFIPASLKCKGTKISRDDSKLCTMKKLQTDPPVWHRTEWVLSGSTLESKMDLTNAHGEILTKEKQAEYFKALLTL